MEKKNKVKQTKKTVKAIDDLYDLTSQLEYFYQNNDKFKKNVLNKAINIEKELYKLSVDKKVFSSKLKEIFNKENRELKEKVAELTEEVKQRGKKIGELVEENKELVEIVVMNKDDDVE
jgi:hypothetical protein